MSTSSGPSGRTRRPIQTSSVSAPVTKSRTASHPAANAPDAIPRVLKLRTGYWNVASEQCSPSARAAVSEQATRERCTGSSSPERRPDVRTAVGKTATVRISAKVDYAVRAAVQLAAAEGSGPVKGDEIAAAQDIPINFLENILSLLRNAGF